MQGSPICYLLLVASARLVATKDFWGRIAHHGTVGLGEEQYAPVTCAWACRATMGSWMLICDAEHSSNSSSMGHDHGTARRTRRDAVAMAPPTPDCYASNYPWLTSLAWCVKAHCPADLQMSQLERWWETNIAGRIENPPLPKISYQDALSSIAAEPKTVHNSSLILNQTELVSEHMYHLNYGAMEAIEINISADNQYSLVVLLTCILIPVSLSLLRFLPWPETWVSRFYARWIDPPVFGSHHAVPVLFGLGIAPTRGQALFILYIWFINVFLSAVGHVVIWPNLWFTSVSDEVAEWVANRTGMMSFANLILSVLFSSRNNPLLYFTSWSRATFVLIHRWLAVICILQACIHSAVYLQLNSYSSDALAAESAYPYWIWGIIGTLALVLILPASVLPVRQRAYRFFLAWHFVFALLGIIGCFLHIYFRYHWQWGYEIWVAAAFAVWAGDWLVARPWRLARNGFDGKAFVTVIDKDYLQVTIPHVEASDQVYLYFPTLSWRVWENHPFSAIPFSGSVPARSCTSSCQHSNRGPNEMDLEAGADKKDAVQGVIHPSSEAQPASETDLADKEESIVSLPRMHAGIALLLRRRGGLTERLAAHAHPRQHLRVWVESSYGASRMSLLRTPLLRPSFAYPRMLFIAGGVGITAVLPAFLAARPPVQTALSWSTRKLYWGVRSASLVRAVENILGESSRAAVDLSSVGQRGMWDGAEVLVSVGKRFDLAAVLRTEVQIGARSGTLVMVCGPPGMLDEVRALVTELATQGALVRLAEEQFST